MKLRFMRQRVPLLVALAVVASPGFAAPFDKGDVNGDGKPGEIGDAFLAGRISLKLPRPGNPPRAFTAQEINAADVFPVNPDTATLGDGAVDIRDVLVFLQGLAQFLGPTVDISKHDVGKPIMVKITASATTITTSPVTLTANVLNAGPGEVTGVNWSIDPGAALKGFTIVPTGPFTATLNPPAGGTQGSVVVTATPTGPGVVGRRRTTAGRIVIQTQPHQQGGG